MTVDLKSSKRNKRMDQAVPEDIEGVDFSNCEIVRIVAKNKKFTKCNFQNSNMIAAYMRNCVFDDCSFVGSTFKDSNLRGSLFVGCRFDYARFSNTIIDRQILASSMPSTENLQQDFARELRGNFRDISDAEGVNKAIKLELEATLVHHYKAWKSKESYYRRKYKGRDRFYEFLYWLKFKTFDILWGNGESIFKLCRSIFVFLISVCALDQMIMVEPFENSDVFASLMVAPEIVFNIHHPERYSSHLIAIIAFCGYILISLFVAAIFRKISRR